MIVVPCPQPYPADRPAAPRCPVRPQYIGRASILIRLSGPRTKGNRTNCPSQPAAARRPPRQPRRFKPPDQGRRQAASGAGQSKRGPFSPVSDPRACFEPSSPSSRRQMRQGRSRQTGPAAVRAHAICKPLYCLSPAGLTGAPKHGGHKSMSDVNPIAEPERAGRPLDAGTAKTSDDSSKPQGAYSFNDRSRPIWAAIRQDPAATAAFLEDRVRQNEHHDFSPEEMVDNMAQRIQQAHSRIIGCCFASRKRLTVMQDEQIRLDLGEPRWSPQHNGPRETKIPNGPSVTNLVP